MPSLLLIEDEETLAKNTALYMERYGWSVAIAPSAEYALQAIDAKYRALIRAKIGEQLRFEPGAETTNRKPLRQPAPFAATKRRQPARIFEYGDRGRYVLGIAQPRQTPLTPHIPRVDPIGTARKNRPGEGRGIAILWR